jgi:hypothetical protein
MDDNSFRPPPRVARALVATDVPLAGTLLESAVTAHKARCIKDCAAYFQSAVDPVGDIFTAGSSLVSSMAVVPFSHNESDLGGITGWGAIYFTLPEPCDFALLQEDVLGAVSATTLTLHARLRDRAAALGPCVAEVTDQRRRSSSIAEGAPGAEAEAASVPGSAGLSKGAPFSANNKKLCTEAMKRVRRGAGERHLDLYMGWSGLAGTCSCLSARLRSQ